ncbi:hypothetical protein KX928_01525 [Roseobacter sp. YSTF-M11]|uniref:Uncharacterized protein n=1 Tax=Roseobacter insulae TaxID=2859783 RepID=A0A9X1JYQ6_9RHOB|nr:hypothetical protein [Roseobacter insulae]MBW4706454.1 hypothetical protein [Roseobacter insulae]
MTDRLTREMPGIRGMTSVHRLCTGRTPPGDVIPSPTSRSCFGSVAVARGCGALILALLLTAGAAHADAWRTFQTRCLDAFEAFSPAVVVDLPRITHAQLPAAYSQEASAYGPTGAGDVVILDPAPLAPGDRLCAVAGKIEDRDEIAAWIVEQIRMDRYEMARRGAATVLLSLEWIEPRLQVTLVLEGLRAGSYSVLETYRES